MAQWMTKRSRQWQQQTVNKDLGSTHNHKKSNSSVSMWVCSNQNHPSKHAGSYCSNQNHPSKHAGSYSEAFWLWPIMAIMASVQPELGKIVHAGSNFLHLTWFCSSKEGPGHIVQNWPGPYQDGLIWFWPNASGPESSQCARTVSYTHLTLPTRFAV